MGIISSPLRIALALYSLYVLLGPSSITALVVLVICMPLQALCVKTSTALLKRALGYTDERAKYEKELLSGMDVVKCSTWEVWWGGWVLWWCCGVEGMMVVVMCTWW